MLFFKGAIFEFTHNLDGIYSQAQMGLLYDVPDQECLNNNKKIKILRAPTGIHDIIFDDTLSKNDYIIRGFVEIEVGIAPIRTQGLN